MAFHGSAEPHGVAFYLEKLNKGLNEEKEDEVNDWKFYRWPGKNAASLVWVVD